jgi:hypothetical protein
MPPRATRPLSARRESGKVRPDRGDVMPADSLDYGRMMQRALHRVIAEALGHVAERGLPGEHHFYITFDTGHPGVDMPGWLRERHDGEMPVVLQHEFADLAVTADRFTVGLAFSGRPATLVIPFAAVKTFVDPSVEFGLRFDAWETPDGGDDGPGSGRRDAAETPPGRDDAAAREEGDAEVVSLDAFRKH